jgi:lysozyme
MKMTAIGRAVLEAREGVRLKAYQDSVGVWTIGVGHTAACGAPVPKAGLTITAAEADAAFVRDLAKFEAAVAAGVKVALADDEADALISIAFNIGVGWFGVGGHQVATFVKLLNAGDRAGCAKHIMDFTKPPEITGRRAAEAEQFVTPYSVALPRPTSAQPRIKAPAAAVVAAPVPAPAVLPNQSAWNRFLAALTAISKGA